MNSLILNIKQGLQPTVRPVSRTGPRFPQLIFKKYTHIRIIENNSYKSFITFLLYPYSLSFPKRITIKMTGDPWQKVLQIYNRYDLIIDIRHSNCMFFIVQDTIKIFWK